MAVNISYPEGDGNMIVRIKNLRLRTVIGINEWERDLRQDVIINVEFGFDSDAAVKSDDIKDAVNYKKLKRKIIKHVESSKVFLLEKMADDILNLVFEDPKVIHAKVEVDKPNALRYTDSVSVVAERGRSA